MNFLYETHMHTAEVSLCSFISAANQVRAYKDAGYTGIIITDHLKEKTFDILRNKSILFSQGLKGFSSWDKKVDFLARGYEKAKSEGDKCGLDVFFAWEYTCNGADFLTYGLGLDFLRAHPYILDLSIEEYSALVRGSGGYLVQAHPYRHYDDKGIGPVNPGLIDGIEVFNGGTRQTKNGLARKFADDNGLLIQAGSDSHRSGVEFRSGIRLDKKADSIFGIINAIKSKNARLILPPANQESAADGLSAVSVRIFFDCKHAKYVSESLCDYIQSYLEMDAFYADIEEMGKISDTNGDAKTIIIGHHSKTDSALRLIGKTRYNKYGMEYGFNRSLCALRATKSELKKSYSYDKEKFIVEFCKMFDETPNDKHTREAQFMFLAAEFIASGLETFLRL